VNDQIYKTVITVYHFPPKEAEASDLCREAETGTLAIITSQFTTEVKSPDDVPREAIEFFNLDEENDDSKDN